ncbi:peptidoglycan/LPS O-acetylase OafA/YrhL [Streptosporangium becharense]|uniref:Peptidoglycan/LPS O-acetylase OafA/YrhL n=1 Tax=Streptosporangium becharense TaxID=1816182 RepID=A0A7W9IGZ0_9ACTN|nr:acyltransferase [Streptosporangium becharense]MBB2909102.1 peptidoglycan/LPS O-acetylase OafA/YrhL [Streptosporangium becharense]MBB5819879.1 peptidoglycan/LPS O-acetylase OafA/YrhL [Streptosporangium becharense]
MDDTRTDRQDDLAEETRAGHPRADREGGRATTGRGRLAGLDGIRGIAALFVMVHHCWLLSFPGYPENTGPAWLGWLLYGHFAVVVFIVLSGFSLSVSPARSGWRLGGVRRFARRRAWRILPPYWAALAFSLAVAWTLVEQPGEGPPTATSVVVYGLLLQDVFGAPSPNGAFWSIAIEAQLYLVFPLLLTVVRRAGAAVMLAAVTAVVAAVGVLAPVSPAVAVLMRLTPQFAVLFAVGVVAAGVLGAGERARRVPWHWMAAVAAAPVAVVVAVRGSVWTVGHYFWVDIALGPAVGLLLAAVATGRPALLVRLLELRPVRRLGSFSYTLYLIHAPIVVAIHQLVVAPRLPSGSAALAGFAVTLALAAPVTLLAAWLFAAVFELPFQRHRTWPELRAAARARLRPRRG